MRILTEAAIREALESHGIEVTFKYDYMPSCWQDKAVYEGIEFAERAWRVLLLAATNRRKSSRQLNEMQVELKRRPHLDERGLHVRVLTVTAALRLQDAGYELQCLLGGHPKVAIDNHLKTAH